MSESEIIQEIRYQEILYLARQRQGTAAYAQRVRHARHRLKEVVFGRSHGVHITQGLFCIFGYVVLATEQCFIILLFLYLFSCFVAFFSFSTAAWIMS